MTTVPAWCVYAHASFVFKIDKALNKMQLLKKIRLNVNDRTSFPTMCPDLNPLFRLRSACAYVQLQTYQRICYFLYEDDIHERLFL